MNPHAVQVIDALGGTAETARIFKLAMPSVSGWKIQGIPEARMMFLRATKSQELQGINLDAATANKARSHKDLRPVIDHGAGLIETVPAGEGA